MDVVCDDEAPKRQLLRWSKAETLVLLHAKRKVSTLSSSTGNNAASSSSVSGKNSDHQSSSNGASEERLGDANKWRRVSEILHSHGFDRDQVACKKRWFHVVSDYRKIHDWQQSAGDSSSFWLLQPQERRENRLPSGFDRDLYKELDVWIGGGSSDNAAGISVPVLDDTANLELEDLDNEEQPEPVNSAEAKSASRKKRKQSAEVGCAENGDSSLIRQALDRNGKGLEAALREVFQAQIDAYKEISQSQLEAFKQVAALQMQQGREMVKAMYAMVNEVGELAKSLRSSANR